MNKTEKILWLQKVINDDDYINNAIIKLARELILILYRLNI